VTGGFSGGGSGETLPILAREATGDDLMLTELARRGGATPLTECSDWRDAFLSSVGVEEPDREEEESLRPFEA
jgi:hypothetical protein